MVLIFNILFSYFLKLVSCRISAAVILLNIPVACTRFALTTSPEFPKARSIITWKFVHITCVYYLCRFTFPGVNLQLNKYNSYFLVTLDTIYIISLSYYVLLIPRHCFIFLINKKK